MVAWQAVTATLTAFCFMEFVAWFTHKYIMHGFLWFLHEDHHNKETQGFVEKNDSFFLIFATPGIILIFTGIYYNFNICFFLGLGITLYGLAYFLIHDVLIHQRFKLFRNANSVYYQAIRRAHKIHHKHLGKYNGESFGMLLVPKKYFHQAKTRKC